MIFEVEAKQRGLDLVRQKKYPEKYRSRTTTRMWEMFVRGMDIGVGYVYSPAVFEEEAFKRYGNINDNDPSLQVMFKIRKVQ